MLRSKRYSKRKLIANIVILALLLVAAVLYVTSRYKYTHFNDAQIDEIIFYFLNGVGDGQSGSIIEAVQDNLLLCGIVFFLLILPVIDFYRNRINIKVDLSFLGRKKEFTFNPSRIPLRYKLAYAILIFSLSLWFLLSNFGVAAYVRSLTDSGRIFEEKYVDPETVNLVFPDKKRNLIYIYLESMENTLASRESGGQVDNSLIPELEAIAKDPDNISFSHQKEGLGGPLSAFGTTWTVGAMTAHMAGIPLKADILGADGNSYGKYDYFLPGAHTLGDVLQEQGYNQTFVMGSKSEFGGRDKLLTQHGGYKIKDHTYAQKTGLIPSDYSVWWGYEDKKLFEFTKDELTRLSALDEPFNVQLLTVDTHFADGWLDPTCPTPHQAQYDNVYACSSKQVSEFVSWIKEQPFYENTTVVISGDHVGMQKSYYDQIISTDNYTRTTYNAIINSAVFPAKDTKGRLFSAFDFYPSTLAAMGVTIPGEQLALGVNLFSDQPTLVEQYGSIESFDAELRKRSSFYNKQIATPRDNAK